ncbi:Inner membrane transport permease YbhR [Polystyrenella longa]|uniref:Transport permease protein n=1 Tax=Polystyrenella longa TaxID=2528007 RepID=A0A518CHK6_9PLAN|nr:ABC transporter permease [Polystyrenella longa]QDU78707.1 Inner membrane transport permease YbhR [Polystyrenella longa]
MTGTIQVHPDTPTGKKPSGAISAAGLAIWALAARELVRFFRQRTRVVGALGQPLIFWILFGAGLHGSFQAPDWAPEGMTYQEYFFPGVVVLIILFTAIFSTISLIEDRREGFLQGVLVAPVPRFSIVLGKLAGGTILALIQAALFLAIGPMLSMVGLAPAMQVAWSLETALAAGFFLTLVAFALTSLGYVIAWPMESTQGFHAIMSVFLMPMWLLSGAFFPIPESGWLAWVMRCNPLTYGVAGLRQLMYSEAELQTAAAIPSIWMCAGIMLFFGLVCTAIAVWMTGRRKAADQR